MTILYSIQTDAAVNIIGILPATNRASAAQTESPACEFVYSDSAAIAIVTNITAVHIHVLDDRWWVHVGRC